MSSGLHRGAIRTDADVLLEHFIRERASASASSHHNYSYSSNSSLSSGGESNNQSEEPCVVGDAVIDSVVVDAVGSGCDYSAAVVSADDELVVVVGGDGVEDIDVVWERLAVSTSTGTTNSDTVGSDVEIWNQDHAVVADN